jgi:hypothetical protein
MRNLLSDSRRLVIKAAEFCSAESGVKVFLESGN